MTEKVAYIAPGYPSSTDADNYQKIGNFFKENGFKVEYINPDWSTEMRDNLEQFSTLIEEATKKHGDHEKYFFGHSLGAMCMFTASPEFEPEAQIMASMSPEFKEEYELNSRWMIQLGRLFNRIAGLFSDTLSIEHDRPKLEDIDGKGKIHFMYAEREYYGFFGIDALGFGRETTEKRLEIFPQAEEIVVEDAKHYMTSEEYLGEIEKVIKKLGS